MRHRISAIRMRNTTSDGLVPEWAEGRSQGDPVQAARWLRLAANKGEHRAQALLGGMLFRGDMVGRQAALGLFWLIVAKDGVGPDEGWITETYSRAFAQATDDERALALRYLEDWLKTRRE